MSAQQSMRIDRWLWFARFFKSRTLAAKVVQSGGVRINGTLVSKSKTNVKPGDELRFRQNQRERVVKIMNIGTRRGPASEAELLYIDHSSVEQRPKSEQLSLDRNKGAVRDKGAGRPTKRDRRAIDRLQDQ